MSPKKPDDTEYFIFKYSIGDIRDRFGVIRVRFPCREIHRRFIPSMRAIRTARVVPP
jgi:hypothetical protein